MSIADEATVRQRSNIPQTLRPQRRWLTWQRRPKPNKPGKFDKIPKYANGRQRHGANGSAADRAQLVEFDEAIAAYVANETIHGIGLALLPDISDCALDLDNCIAPDGTLSDLARRVVDSGTYVERSPSGTGVRALFAGKIGIDAKNHAAGVEVFDSRGFCTVTGDRLGGESLLACPPALLEEILTTVRAGRRSKASRDDIVSHLPPPENPDAGSDVRLPLTLWKRLEKPYRDGCDRSREAFLIALDLNRAGVTAEQALALMARPDCDVLTPALERRGGDIESARVWLWKYCVAPAYQGGAHGR